jgi:hypothetical protein
MKRSNLFLLFIPVFSLSFIFKISACSCLCITRTNFDSLLDIRCTIKGTQPDSILTKFLSLHENVFLGTIESVEISGHDTESVQVKIDTIIKGHVTQKNYPLINVPYHGDCISSVKRILGFHFLGYINPQKSPVHLRDLGFSIIDCGSGLDGYFYRSGSLVRLESVVTDSNTFGSTGIWAACTTEVLLFDIGKLFNTSIKENLIFRNTSQKGLALQFYSIKGEKLNKLTSNSVVIVSNNKRKYFCFKKL